jgi:alpha-methylacyl-CoA racemase
LIEKADALIEGFRPGVMERLGLGPDVCLKRNPKLVYGRMTGWGQDGPIAHTAGHDINYIALSGMLHCIGEADRPPTPPLNLVGDFGGGGMMLAFGVACGIVESQRSGKGQVIDSSMHEGAAALGAMFFSMRSSGMWTDKRADNLLDGGAHFYGTYETSDGKYVSIGSIESQFYAELLHYTGINDPEFQGQMKRENWPALKEKLAAVFKTKTRDEWTKIMQDTDICFAPVLTLEEALKHEHNVARKSFVEVEGVPQPAPTPRFSRTVPEIQRAPVDPGTDNEPVLRDWGFAPDAIESLRAAQAI